MTPASTRQGTDRFTMGLIIEVAEVIEAHGYGRCDGRQFVELLTITTRRYWWQSTIPHQRRIWLPQASCSLTKPGSTYQLRVTGSRGESRLSHKPSGYVARSIMEDRVMGHELRISEVQQIYGSVVNNE